MRLSEIVKKYREEHGLSQRDLAKLSGLSNAQISNVERELNTAGKPFTPSIDTITKLANAMGRSANDLMSDMDDMDVYFSPTDEIRDELKDNPELRVLLSTAADLTKEDLIALAEIAKRFHR